MVAGLIVLMVIIGALIGYSAIGGGNPVDVFKNINVDSYCRYRQ